MSDPDEDMAIVRRAIDQLSEHFDSCQIFVTRYEGNDNGTTNINYGSGNWFTRHGQIAAFVKVEDQRSIRADTKRDNE